MEAAPLRVWAGSLPQVDVTDRAARLALNPIVRGHLDTRLPPADRAARYGALLSDYRFTDPAEAEVALLPIVVEQTGDAEVRSFVGQAERHGLRTLIFSAHDLEPIMPSASIILMHPGPTRDAQPVADVLAVPYFFTDRANGTEGRPDSEQVTVAFCGQGASRRGASVARAASRAGQAMRNRIRSHAMVPPPRGHVALRAEALHVLRDHPGVADRFVIRDRYRAGASNEHDRAHTEAEFDENLRSAIYALCVRGTGNFSARFYEALSFGRVPLFVDTGCILPFEHEIDWRDCTVWLDASDVSAIGDRLVAAHPEVMADPIRSAPALRRLWEDRLTQHGYFRHLVPTLRSLLRPAPPRAASQAPAHHPAP